jgi:hypothetical protein|tara:strand:- start:581 stop:691 length:111 start_codon:yes stop_codon:yes gene_type:complete
MLCTLERRASIPKKKMDMRATAGTRPRWFHEFAKLG